MSTERVRPLWGEVLGYRDVYGKPASLEWARDTIRRASMRHWLYVASWLDFEATKDRHSGVRAAVEVVKRCFDAPESTKLVQRVLDSKANIAFDHSTTVFTRLILTYGDKDTTASLEDVKPTAEIGRLVLAAVDLAVDPVSAPFETAGDLTYQERWERALDMSLRLGEVSASENYRGPAPPKTLPATSQADMPRTPRGSLQPPGIRTPGT